MGLRSTRQAVTALAQSGQLVTVEQEIDPYLEAAAIVRRVYEAKGPAVLFARTKGSSMPMLGNLFGTLARARFLFGNALESVAALVDARKDPERLVRRPLRALRLPGAALHLVPKAVRSAAALAREISISELPAVVGWRGDGGPFITLPQVYSEDPDAPGWAKSNLGMYRVQLAGGRYRPNEQVGLHYQIHRGIGVHHAKALAKGQRLAVNIFVGGPPAMTLAAVMPLPEGLPELAFAGALLGERLSTYRTVGRPLISADADVVIQGTIEDGTLPEGPFGDHLGYYSLQHDFPVLRVEKVTARRDAIWPFTTVGRPPQEDTTFGELIHELTGPLVPEVFPGIHAVHAVDAAGVHPLLLAIGSERYVPYRSRTEPQELLTQANGLLGQGQTSLAKWLFIAAREDDPRLSVDDIRSFFRHVLERVDFRRDLHFQTRTTIDTLDYSGHGLNRGSKVVVAAVGPAIRALATELPALDRLPEGLSDAKLILPGVVAIGAERHDSEQASRRMAQWLVSLGERDWKGVAVIVLCDDPSFVAASIRNWLWVTFTRADPAVDVRGIHERIEHKHYGCDAPIVIDARIKAHHAPPLVDDPAINARVDALAARGGPLHGII